MHRNTLFSILATAALGIVMAGPVNAGTTYRWIGNGSDEYHTDTNWNPTGVPGTGDKAIVTPFSQPNGYLNPVLDDQDRLLGELVIGSDFTLTVTGVKLTLDGMTPHDIDGELRLSDAAAQVEFTATVTVGGDGSIKGENNSAQLRIAKDNVLTNTTSIVGMMKIAGLTGGTNAGKLVNQGLVYANGDGTLELGANLLLDDSTGGVRWKAGNNSGAILVFKNTHTGGSKLEGDFAVANCAKLKFEKTIETNGTFDTGAAAGFVDVDAGNSVEFRYDCVGGCTVIDSDQTYGPC